MKEGMLVVDGRGLTPENLPTVRFLAGQLKDVSVCIVKWGQENPTSIKAIKQLKIPRATVHWIQAQNEAEVRMLILDMLLDLQAHRFFPVVVTTDMGLLSAVYNNRRRLTPGLFLC